MGSSTDGSGEARGAPSSEDSDENGQRGLLGRLIDALSPAETGSSGSAPPQDIPPAGMLPGVGNLRTLHVDDVAVPKAEIVAVPVTIDRDSLADVFREHGFSRLPVYQDTLDRPLGLVMLKDFALTCGFGADPEGFDLQPMLRPALYVPPSMPLAVLLQKMRTERVHMALMIDEYGGVDGLVTIEDLIETVVGDIADEHDAEEDAMWVEEAPGVFLVQSRAPLDEFEAAIGMRLHDDGDDEDIDTLGGLVFLRAGRVPARGEVVPHESGAEFEVIDADPRRIKRLRLRLPEAPAPAAVAAAGG